jgi:hypothetical protein
MTMQSTMTVVLAACALALLPGCGLAGNGGAAPAQPNDDAVADPSLTAWDDLEIGDCVLETDWDTQLDGGGVKSVDCDEEHTDELFQIVVHENGPFPGSDELLSFADSGCQDAFEGYVGATLEASGFDYSYTAPSEKTWAAGDRESLCFLFDFKGDLLTGSARGSGS